jgi:F-type H+-transporting ATPase subunit epsilon
MLPEAIELTVVTPERQLVRETVVEVTIPGELAYRTAASSLRTSLAVIRGFAEVLPDHVTVLAETAERAEEIDLARAEAARARAEHRLASNDPNLDWDRATVALQRSLIRIQIATKHHAVPVEPQ